MATKPTGEGRVFVRVVAILLTICCLAGPVAARGAVAQDELPAAIVEGTCDNPGKTAADLRPLTAAAGGALTSFTTIDLAIGDLTGGGYAVVAGDPIAPVACGEIDGDGDDVYVTVRPRGDARLGGIAWLHARDDRTQVSLFMSEELGGSGTTAEPTEEPSDQPEPPVDETPVPTKTPPANATQPAGETTTYTSPTFDHTITYDTGVWNGIDEGTDQDQAGPIDFFILNGRGEEAVQVEFYGLQPERGDTALDVIANMERNILTNPELIDPAVRTDAGGDEIRGGDENHAFLSIDFSWEDEEGNRYSNVYYIEVWAMPAVDGALIMVYQTPQDVYDDWIPARETLVQGITLPE
jgi:hypothetical protein